MNVLTWASNDQGGFLIRVDEREQITVKPVLTFEFDSIYFEPTNTFKVIAGENIMLTDEEKTECETYITNATINHMILSVNADGLFLGLIAFDLLNTEVSHAPPNEDHWRWDFTTSTWVYINAVDVDGLYLGNVPIGSYVEEVTGAPAHSYERWDLVLKQWYDARALEQYAADEIAGIELVSGSVRNKYMTTTDGMSGVYVYKAQQAKDYLADASPVDANYPLVAAEQLALQVATPAATMIDAANFIMAKEAAWISIISDIEIERRTCKEQIALAVDRAGVDAAVGAAVANMELI